MPKTHLVKGFGVIWPSLKQPRPCGKQETNDELF